MLNAIQDYVTYLREVRQISYNTEISYERDLRKALYDVARFLSTKTSTVTGARKAQSEFVKTMNEMGYSFINKQNAQQFGEFMREVKKHADYKGRDSEQLVDLYKTANES